MTMTADYDPTLKHDLVESFIRTRSDLAPCGSREVIDAGVEFLVIAMIQEVGGRSTLSVRSDHEVVNTFLRDLRCAVARARQG